jgi:hypothetical protein
MAKYAVAKTVAEPGLDSLVEFWEEEDACDKRLGCNEQDDEG